MVQCWSRDTIKFRGNGTRELHRVVTAYSLNSPVVRESVIGTDKSNSRTGSVNSLSDPPRGVGMSPHQGLRFWVWGWGCGLRASSFGLRVSCLGFQISVFETRISGFGLRISNLGFRVSGFGYRILGFGIRDSGSEFRVEGLRVRGRIRGSSQAGSNRLNSPKS